jgi:hypothetical protein
VPQYTNNLSSSVTIWRGRGSHDWSLVEELPFIHSSALRLSSTRCKWKNASREPCKRGGEAFYILEKRRCTIVVSLSSVHIWTPANVHFSCKLSPPWGRPLKATQGRSPLSFVPRPALLLRSKLMLPAIGSVPPSRRPIALHQRCSSSGPRQHKGGRPPLSSTSSLLAVGSMPMPRCTTSRSCRNHRCLSTNELYASTVRMNKMHFVVGVSVLDC